MCHVLLLFMGNAIFGAGDRKTTESARSGAADPKTAVAAMDELTRDVARLKADMDEKDRTIEQLARTVDEIRVSCGHPARVQICYTGIVPRVNHVKRPRYAVTVKCLERHF